VATLFSILEGRASEKEATKITPVKARKSRVKIYKTIEDALAKGAVGDMFSTKGASRIYVISRADWGDDSSGKIAKGFTPGSSTPSSDFESIKAHSIRTKLKHGETSSERLKKKYGPGAKNKIKNSKSAVKGG